MILTPWGEVDVMDAHVHFFSPAFYRSLAEQKKAAEVGSMLGWDVPESAEYLAERWVVEMDHNGVGGAVAIGSIPVDIESVGVATDLFPERFRGITMVNPMLAGADMRCQSALAEGLIHGIFLFPAMHCYSLHDQHVRSLIATVGAYPHAVVYVHCGMLSVGFRKKLGLPSPFNMGFSNPIDLHQLAMEFPRLRFVIPHFGGGYFREALMVADLCPNVYFDTSSSNRWMRTDPASPDLVQVFRKAIEVLGPERLLFGTDSSWFPRGWVKDVLDKQVEALLAAGVDEAGARSILGGNLRRLFSWTK